MAHSLSVLPSSNVPTGTYNECSGHKGAQESLERVPPAAKRRYLLVLRAIEQAGYKVAYTATTYSLTRYILADFSAFLADSATTMIQTNDATITTIPRKLQKPERLIHKRWGECTKNLRTQWQVINYVDAVFIGAIVTMLQDDIVSTNDIAQPLAVAAFLCTLASLCWGVVFYVHMEKRRDPHGTRTWIHNAASLRLYKWWNIEVMFSMPLIWLLWSAIFFGLSFLLAYVCNIKISIHRSSFSGVLGGAVMLVWAVQVPLVVWTLSRLGRPRSLEGGESESGTIA